MVTLVSGGQLGQQFQTLRQLGHGLDHGRARHRPTSGPVPIGDPLLNKTRSCAVVGKKLGLCFACTGKLLLQHPHDAGVKLLAPAAQQGAVGGILYKRVLESVLRVRRRPAPENQLGAHEPRQGVVQFLLWHPRHCADQLM